jgi:uncharacterized protein (DUF433 family)
MEGDSLMDELRRVVFQELRKGVSIQQILNHFKEIENELMTMKDYAKAMEEAHKAP